MKSEHKSHIRNTLVAVMSGVPLVGGPLSVIMDKYLPNELERRRSELLEAISSDLEQLERQGFPLVVNSPEFLSTFLKVLRHATEEHRREKTIAFRNILINSVLSEEAEFNERDAYIHLIDDLTADQIRVLHLFYLRDVKGTIHFDTDENIYTYLHHHWPSMDEYYALACTTELFRRQIISGSGKRAAETGKRGHLLTPFGERFINFVFSPVTLEKQNDPE